jgi:ADP-heptose:LPS heptosyltransferase
VLLAPLSFVSRRRQRSTIPNVPRILVFEFWHLGDAVMLDPLLRALRGRFPRAEISLLCKPATRVLLEPGHLVDRFFEIDVPWTAFKDKYDWRRYVGSGFMAMIRELRRERFDVSIDSRMDVRSNILAWLVNARRRIGFDFPGGRGLLTDRLPAPGEGSHKVIDWLSMLAPIGGVPDEFAAPALDIPEATQAVVNASLHTLGITSDTRLVAVYPSAGQMVKRWPIHRFVEVVTALEKLEDTRVLVLVDPDGYGEILGEAGAICVRASLAELPAFLSRCALFIGNDTGPAHMAAAVGVPTITIFGPGVSNWYRPFGPGHRVVQVDRMPCRPCFDNCTQLTNICLQSIPTERVLDVVNEVLESAAVNGAR